MQSWSGSLSLPHTAARMIKKKLAVVVLIQIFIFLLKSSREREKNTYNTGDSPVVTHLSTSPAISSLSRAERTGCRVFYYLWSYVIVYCDVKDYIPRGQVAVFVIDNCYPLEHACLFKHPPGIRGATPPKKETGLISDRLSQKVSSYRWKKVMNKNHP